MAITTWIHAQVRARCSAPGNPDFSHRGLPSNTQILGASLTTSKLSAQPHAQLYQKNQEIVSLALDREVVGFLLLRIIRQLHGFTKEVPTRALNLREGRLFSDCKSKHFGWQMPSLKSRSTL